jgi:hypothetical protein
VCAGSPWLGGTPHVGLLIAGIHSCYCEHKEAGFFFYVLYQVVPAGHSLPVTPIRPCVLHVLLEGRQSYFSFEVGNGSDVLPYRVPTGVPNVLSMCSLILSHMLIIPMCSQNSSTFYPIFLGYSSKKKILSFDDITPKANEQNSQ